MLVDDDAHMHEIHARMLRSMGYWQISAAASAKEALLQLEHDPHSAEVIVCDLNMPEMDGIAFLQSLNASPNRASVILLSGSSLRVMHSVQKLLGGSQLTILGSLTKPAGREVLRDLLECWRPPTEIVATSANFVVTPDELAEANLQRQWVLHYQPQVNLRTGALLGMEALIRWNHPLHGLVYPDAFIALAEDRGAIDELTNWVIQEAAYHRASWQSQGLNVQIALNVSIESLRAPDYWKRLTALVRDAKASPQDITLEVTESRVISTSNTALENLVRLRLAQFALSIDDFGTGHSSLAQLRDVPFTELKIDRGFVRGARTNQIIRPILEGSLGIARRMGMTSVAEGVETASDWNLLRNLECDRAQGYFIGEPMGAERIYEWLREWQSRLPSLVS
jgi:EAL domain-containing protein (putative c-di-GMP-specific phosphodiesterase class I)/ActR/RegA family two-component response regulator